jgi:Protein of unknown function (DUF2971)
VNLLSNKEALYHYTSLSSLQGIVENKSIWMTNAYYLNDSNEISYAIGHFESLVDDGIKNKSTSKLEGFLRELKDWLPNMRYNPHYIFVFSLSKQRNLLSQWRAYAPHGSGVNIGFEVEALKRLCAQKNLDLVECVYSNQDQDRILKSLLGKIVDSFSVEFSNLPDNHEAKTCEYLDFLNGQAETLLKEFCRIKDSTFSEECEWRLVSKYYHSYTDSDIKFRPGKTALIPYIEVNLSSMRNDGYLFETIVVGPSPNFNLAFQSVSAYLSNKHACRETHSSQSPFREI